MAGARHNKRHVLRIAATSGSARCLLCALLTFALSGSGCLDFAHPALAQNAPAITSVPAVAPQGPASLDGPPPPKPIDDKKLELRGIEEILRDADGQRQKIQTDLETARADRARLSTALIEATARTQAAEAKVGDVEKRLDEARASEDAIRRSLESRRAVIAEVLAALQRMGRKSPPAVVVTPEDMLQAVRTSMMLGAVVPELRMETEALASDLKDLIRVREAVGNERSNLTRSVAELSGEQKRVASLIEERTRAQSGFETALDSEAARARELGRQASDLKDLITKMEAEAVRRAALAPPEEPVPGPPKPGALPSGPSLARPDLPRLGPVLAFADTRGRLHLPVSGSVLKGFGAADGFGGTEKGLSIATRAGAIVAAPSDARVVFSGPYRSYGQLLILSAGGGYHLVLAGMDRMNVAVGQFVLAGEPIGTMGEGSSKTASAIAIGVAQPVLYVEFRKDGAAIDPSPWWAKSDMEKARG